MSLYVDIRINDKVIATAAIANLSNLEDTSDYTVSVVETGNESLDIPYMNQQWLMKGHPRNQSVWALVCKVAQSAALMSEKLRN